MTSKILLDTNIVIDYCISTREEHDSALQLMEMVGNGEVTGAIAASSLNDFYYVARKYSTDEWLRAQILELCNICEILPVSDVVCRVAAQSNEPDFEDGIIRACAELNSVEFIITRDAAAFQHSRVRSMSASTYLELFAE